VSVSRTSRRSPGSSPRTDVTNRDEIDRASATRWRGSAVTGDVREAWELERLGVERAAEAFGVPVRAGCGSESMSVAVARGIAERVHAGQVDERGEPYIAHVGRVAAGVPLFARSVGWLHAVMERSRVDESVLLAAGASLDERLALRLLRREEGARSDDAYLEHVRVIALSAGVSGRIARAVERADLRDHVVHRAVRSGGWTPPYGAGLVVLMMVSANSQDAGPAWL
jgi:hypothetical protein